MSICKTCGGAIFAKNEVTGYGGPTCSGMHTNQHTSVEQLLAATAKPPTTTPQKPTNTDFIQWLYFRDHGEVITKERIIKSWKEYNGQKSKANM